jgi:hypothetical protein
MLGQNAALDPHYIGGDPMLLVVRDPKSGCGR